MNEQDYYDDDRKPAPPSPRNLAASSLAAKIKEAGLADPVGGESVKDGSNRYYSIAFSRRGSVHGECRLFSVGYVSVWYRAVPDCSPLSPQDRRLFASVEEAYAFLKLAFVDGDYVGASEVPQYVHKRPQKGAQPAAPALPAPATQVFPDDFDEDFFSPPGDDALDGASEDGLEGIL